MFDRQEISIETYPEGTTRFSTYFLALYHWLFRRINYPIFARTIRQIYSVAQPPERIYHHRHLSSSSPDSDNILTVLSSNLWHDWPRHRRLLERLEAFARLAEEEDADVILLQEVARTKSLSADEWLAKRLGMDYVYTRANGHDEIGFEEGLAIFSRYPMRSPLARQLSSPFPFLHRMALGADIYTPAGSMRAFSVHLGLSRNNNALQQSQLRKWITGMQAETPVLIGGDFNAHETSPQMLQTKSTWMDTFRQAHSGMDSHTHSLHMPWGQAFHRRRLDYIFLQTGNFPWKILDAAHLRTQGVLHSDHHAVLARMSPG